MKTLPLTFKKKGFRFQQLARIGLIAIFRKTLIGTDAESFEVVRIRQYPDRMISGALIPASEALPPDSAWGTDGWTCGTEARALEKFADVCADKSNIHPHSVH